MLDQTKLVKQFVLVETKLDTINHDANDMVFAIRQLTNDITKGIGSDKVKKFIQEEVKRLKPTTFKDFFNYILKTQFETRKATLEVARRGVFNLSSMGTHHEPVPLNSASSTDQQPQSQKRPRPTGES